MKPAPKQHPFWDASITDNHSILQINQAFENSKIDNKTLVKCVRKWEEFRVEDAEKPFHSTFDFRKSDRKISDSEQQKSILREIEGLIRSMFLGVNSTNKIKDQLEKGQNKEASQISSSLEGYLSAFVASDLVASNQILIYKYELLPVKSSKDFFERQSIDFIRNLM